MNPLASRQPAIADIGPPSTSDVPMQAVAWTDNAGQALNAPDAPRHQGDLFLPGWLKIELQPAAEQGPGA